MQYMRAHGNTPGPTQRPKLAGLLTAILAELPAAFVLWRAGALVSLAHTIGVQPWLTLIFHAGALALAGAVYGQVFSRAANDRRGGWLFGIGYGYLLWMLGPVALLQWVIARPVATGSAAIGMLVAHLLYGLALGLLFPSIHRLLQRKLGDVMQPVKEKKEVRRLAETRADKKGITDEQSTGDSSHRAHKREAPLDGTRARPDAASG
jgi:hypothetical protein